MEKKPTANQPKYIIDPKDVTVKDELRVRAWAAEVMRRHEYLLNDRIKDRHIIASDDIKPEDIDVRNIYPFPNLHWIIYRNKTTFDLMLLSGKKMLCNSSFAKI